MANAFNYSKWDHIELSDDEEDCHPNIEKESWFRMKHRARVEREEREEADRVRIAEKMAKNAARAREIRRALKNMGTDGDGDDSDDDALDDRPTLLAELGEIEANDASMRGELETFEKNKKWNVDNICKVMEEKTIITSSAGTSDFDEKSGYALPAASKTPSEEKEAGSEKGANAKASAKPAAKTAKISSKKSAPPSPVTGPTPVGPVAPKTPSADVDNSLVLDYHDFTVAHGDLMEEFMVLPSLESSRKFLVQHGGVMLQENASSYLLLASLEDEMNGHREKMRRTAHQSQILSNIVELSKTLKKHPGNVVGPFFKRMEEPEHHSAFLEGVEGFIKNIIKRAVVKRQEMDDEEARRVAALRERTSGGGGGDRTHLVRTDEGDETVREVDLADLPPEERLGPGGLDPVEVFENLPKIMQEAFESRDVNELKKAVASMDPGEAEKHMKKCVAAGLWNEG